MDAYQLPIVPVPFTWPKSSPELFNKLVEQTLLASHSSFLPPALPNPTWDDGTTSLVYRTVVKCPNFKAMEFDGKEVSNGHDISHSFLRELRVYRVVTPHPSIPRFFGVVEHVGMMLQQVEGIALEKKFSSKSEPPAAQDKLKWAREIFDAMLHIHSFGLSHGSIDPHDIFITSDNRVVLIDFGRSSIKGELVFPGTLPYMAPEINYTSPQIISGAIAIPDIDPILADAFSFGVLLLGMERGRLIRRGVKVEVKRRERLPLFGKLIALYLKEKDGRVKMSVEHRELFGST